MASIGVTPNIGRPVVRTVVALLLLSITSIGVAGEIHIHPSGSLRMMKGSTPSGEKNRPADDLDDGIEAGDSHMQKDATLFDIGADGHTKGRKKRIMRRQVRRDQLPRTENGALLTSAPSLDASMLDDSTGAAMAPVASSGHAPASSPGNVELTLSWRDSLENLPKLLVEVARVESNQRASSNSNTMALRHQNSQVPNPSPTPAAATPSPMPTPDTSDDSTKGLPLFLFFVILMCCCCGCIGSCIYFGWWKRRGVGASEPLISQTLEPDRDTRSYREKKKQKKAGKSDADDEGANEESTAATNEENTAGETGGSGTTSNSLRAAASNALPKQDAPANDDDGEKSEHL